MPSSKKFTKSSPHYYDWTDTISYGALATLALSFPVLTLCVFHPSIRLDRVLASHILSCIFAACVYIAFTVPFFTKKNVSSSLESSTKKKQRERSISQDRTGEMEHDNSILETVSIRWSIFSCIIHLSWELGWLLFHKTIRQNRDSPFAYPWWSYIDGGDARYAPEQTSTLVYCLEVCSVINGVVGFFALDLYATFKNQQTKKGVKTLSMMLFTAFAVYHLASCFIYFLSEAVEGFQNVNTESWFDLYVKFFLVNSPWLVFPWVVLRWVWFESCRSV